MRCSATLASFRRLVCLRQNALLPTKSWSMSVFRETDVACLRGFSWRPDRLNHRVERTTSTYAGQFGVLSLFESLRGQKSWKSCCTAFCSVVTLRSECQSCSSPIKNRQFVVIPLLQLKCVWFLSALGEWLDIFVPLFSSAKYANTKLVLFDLPNRLWEGADKTLLQRFTCSES